MKQKTNKRVDVIHDFPGFVGIPCGFNLQSKVLCVDDILNHM